MFSILWNTTLMFWVTFNLSSGNDFKLGKPKILSSGKGLIKSTKTEFQALPCWWQLQKKKSLTIWLENIVGNGENAIDLNHCIIYLLPRRQNLRPINNESILQKTRHFKQWDRPFKFKILGKHEKVNSTSFLLLPYCLQEGLYLRFPKTQDNGPFTSKSKF